MIHRPAPQQSFNIDHARADHSYPALLGAAVAGALWTAFRASASRRTRALGAAAAVLLPLVALRVATDTSWLFDELAGLAIRAGSQPHHPPHPTTTGRRRQWRRPLGAVVAAAAIFAAVPVGISYGTYLSAPGSAAVTDRTVEFLRDQGLAMFVDRAESWWLWRRPPRSAATSTTSRHRLSPRSRS